MVDRRRHAPIARSRQHYNIEEARGLQNVYRGRSRRIGSELLDFDHEGGRRGGHFRWLVSTCLAAAVGMVGIGVVVFGSLEKAERPDGVPSVLVRVLRESQANANLRTARPRDGLRWSYPKADRLLIAADVPTARHVIHEQVKVIRNNRPFIKIRPYVRVVANLYAQDLKTEREIPAFNPLKFYAAAASKKGKGDSLGVNGAGSISVKVVPLLGGILPAEDGQVHTDIEAIKIVTEIAKGFGAAAIRPGLKPEGIDVFATNLDGASSPAERFIKTANTTVLQKVRATSAEQGDDSLEKTHVRVIRVARGDTLERILRRQGAARWQARAMVAAGKPLFKKSSLAVGHEVRVTLVPSLTRQGKMEPARFSVFSSGHVHLVSVNRNAAGEFSASSTPFDKAIVRAALGHGDKLESASLYKSLYYAGAAQGLDDDVVLRVLRIHAYDTDYRRRIRPGDRAEWFFDTPVGAGEYKGVGTLLYTMIRAGGEVSRFWRFRSQDGTVDFYDEFGNNSKKFLMRRPVRGANVRLTSGFGVRFHPILRYARPHRGVDWAGPVGTPILAAGRGIVEFAGRKGQNGKYIRIRHANGYKTAYAHLHRIAPNISSGRRVRQGQVIGQMGSTGLSTASHLHYEVLVNSRKVDPLSIKVGRERRLTGRDLADFRRERARIDELMRRQPVKTERGLFRQAAR